MSFLYISVKPGILFNDGYNESHCQSCCSDDVAATDYCRSILHNLVRQCNKNFINKCAHQNFIIQTCCDLQIFSSPTGVYTIRKEQFDTASVYCDMDNDDGGWIVVQRNKNGSAQSFNQNLDSYEIGFGNLTGEFWYGLKGISCFTQTRQWELRIDIQNADKSWTYLHYNQFKVGTASEGYPLTIGGNTQRGTDYFAGLSGRKFSTPDVDNDAISHGHCAAAHMSGWWYSSACNILDINRQPPVLFPNPVRFTEMKIRPFNCISP